MTKDKDVIELHGKRYHALTGAFLGEHRPAPAAKPHTPAHPSTASLASRQAASHLNHHRPQPTRTLMRRAVKAPAAASLKPALKTQAPLAPATAASGQGVRPAIQPKLTASAVNPQRSHRAAKVDRSRLVKHFQTSEFLPAVTQQSPAHLQPASAAQRHPARTPAAPRQPVRLHRQALQAVQATQPRPTPTKAAAADDQDQDIFERALAMAVSHEQRPPKQSLLNAARRRKRVRRIVSLASGLAVFLVLAGFIAYQNKTNIQLQLASAKAGFAASDPVYKPAGFSMQKIAYGPGTVSTWYNSGEKSFNVVQKKSNWDSQTLLENFVATSDEEYQGYQSGGRTIYVYGQGKATWVDGGVWYQVNASNHLSTDQLVKVAASM